MKQYNIFGDIDILDDDGNIMRCCMCGIALEKGQLCDSEKCANDWADKFFSIDNLDS
jgi:exosome complex RNA-binding protein Rrp42 (RNase PH superfamily)